MLATLAALLLAAPQGGYYQAAPAAAPAKAQVIAGELVWRCGADGCTAGRSGARPVVDCQGLVRVRVVRPDLLDQFILPQHRPSLGAAPRRCKF